jgi:glycine C-acetyltransferase
MEINGKLLELYKKSKEKNCNPFYRPISEVAEGEVVVDGKKLVMIGANDYLGLRMHPKVQEAGIEAVKRWGTGPGGSRILCGNIPLHEELEGRLADLVGKKGAVVYTTGFLANIGALQSLCSAESIFLCDQESHASLYEGGWASRAKVVPFAHNSLESARSRIVRARAKGGNKEALIVTEGVFSMSGDVSALPDLVKLKKSQPGMKLFLDDAHGLGVLGEGGSGTASMYGLTSEVDYIMGTFSKALASVGGFIACDDESVLFYLKHQSKAMLFTAALPASCTAAVLAALDLLEAEPERLDQLKDISTYAVAGYREIGLNCGDDVTPIIPVMIGDEMLAMCISEELLDLGVYALPAIYPAVPKGKAIIRTAYSSAHTKEQVDKVLEAFKVIAKRYPVIVEPSFSSSMQYAELS